MASKKQAPKKEAKKEVEKVAEKPKFDTYVSKQKVKAKIFEQGDEDGIMHIGGLDASLAKDDSELIPYININDQERQVMQFGQGYLVEHESGSLELMSKDLFETCYKKS